MNYNCYSTFLDLPFFYSRKEKKRDYVETDYPYQIGIQEGKKIVV